MSAATYAALTARDTRRHRIDGAMAEAWLMAARMNRASLARALREREAFLSYGLPASVIRTDATIVELRTCRQALLDIRRIARESFDG